MAIRPCCLRAIPRTWPQPLPQLSSTRDSTAPSWLGTPSPLSSPVSTPAPTQPGSGQCRPAARHLVPPPAAGQSGGDHRHPGFAAVAGDPGKHADRRPSRDRAAAVEHRAPSPGGGACLLAPRPRIAAGRHGGQGRRGLGHAQAPATPVHDHRRPRLDEAETRRLRDALPQATISIVPSSGHLPHLADPDRFAQLLADTGHWRGSPRATPHDHPSRRLAACGARGTSGKDEPGSGVTATATNSTGE